MATTRWLGRAAATFDKWTITVSGVWAAADTGTITINGKNLVLTAGAAIGITDGGAGSTVTVAVNDAELVAIAGLTSAADKLPYFSGSGSASLADFTTQARQLLDDSSFSAMQAQEVFASYLRRSSITWRKTPGFAEPFVSFIPWPTRNWSALSFPVLKSAATCG